LQGVANLLAAIDQTRRTFGRAGKVVGILLTMVDRRRGSDVQHAELVRSHYGKLVLDGEIPTDARAVEAGGFGKTVPDFAPGSRAAVAYLAVAQELRRKMES